MALTIQDLYARYGYTVYCRCRQYLRDDRAAEQTLYRVLADLVEKELAQPQEKLPLAAAVTLTTEHCARGRAGGLVRRETDLGAILTPTAGDSGDVHLQAFALERYECNDLSVPERAPLVAHLERCSVCQGQLESLKKDIADFRRVIPYARFAPEYESQRRRRRNTTRRRRLLLTAGVALLMAVSVGFVVTRGHRHDPKHLWRWLEKSTLQKPQLPARR